MLTTQNRRGGCRLAVGCDASVLPGVGKVRASDRSTEGVGNERWLDYPARSGNNSPYICRARGVIFPGSGQCTCSSGTSNLAYTA